MRLHDSTFGYLIPTEEQKQDMLVVRNAAADYAEVLDRKLPEGPDKTYILRTLRTLSMWANVAITRHPDGTPRQDPGPAPAEYPPDQAVKGDLGSVPL